MRLTLDRPLSQHKVWQAGLLALGGAVAVWLGYAFGRGQSLADISHLYRDQNQLLYTVDNGQWSATLDRTGGDLKPEFRAPDGTMLMDYSDWDYNAVVVVDGQRYEFVRLVPSTSVDYDRYRIVEGLDEGDWVLSREVTLSGTSADVNFTFVANKPVHDVQVNIPHTDWYYLSITPRDDGFTATVPHASRLDVESGAITTPSYQLRLQAITPGPLPKNLVRVSLATPYGVQSVTTEYHLTDPPVGQYVQVVREHLTWQHL